MLTKRLLRQTIKKDLKNNSKDVKIAKSHLIVKQLWKFIRTQKITKVFVFSPLPDEVDLKELMVKIVTNKRQLFLPKVISTDPPEMKIQEIKNLSELAPGSFDIFEPQGGDFVSKITPELFLTPGLAFDRNGNRLGRGKGFFDKFFADCTQLDSQNLKKRIGVCFDFQIQPKIPVDQYDLPVSKIVSEKGILNCSC